MFVSILKSACFVFLDDVMVLCLVFGDEIIAYEKIITCFKFSSSRLPVSVV